MNFNRMLQAAWAQEMMDCDPYFNEYEEQRMVNELLELDEVNAELRRRFGLELDEVNAELRLIANETH